MDDLDKIQGSFIREIYRSDNYMVAIFKTEDGPITVTGPSFEYEDRMMYELTGSYVDHPKYGFQFNIMQISKFLPNKKDEIISFLRSDVFKGIGKKTAEKMKIL